MPIRSWKNWILFAAGLITLIMPYIGIPRGVKDFFFVICGLTVVAIAVNLLWPYEPSRNGAHHKASPSKRRVPHSVPHENVVSEEHAPASEAVPEVVTPIETLHEEKT